MGYRSRNNLALMQPNAWLSPSVWLTEQKLKAWTACGFCLLFAIGCGYPQRRPASTVPIEPPSTPNVYTASNFDWSSVQRIVLMPLANQSSYPHPKVGRSIQLALATELQNAGRFEVVAAPPASYSAASEDAYSSGTFDELKVLKVARQFQAQGVVFGAVTQYSAYWPPKIGISLVMVSPAQAVVVASLDGLWDARQKATANKARQFHNLQLSWTETLLGPDRTLRSPEAFQRFVSHEVAQSWSSVLPPNSPEVQTPGQGDADLGPPETDNLPNILEANLLGESIEEVDGSITGRVSDLTAITSFKPESLSLLPDKKKLDLRITPDVFVSPKPAITSQLFSEPTNAKPIGGDRPARHADELSACRRSTCEPKHPQSPANARTVDEGRPTIQPAFTFRREPKSEVRFILD